MNKEYIEVEELKSWIDNWFAINKYYHPYSKSNNIPTEEMSDIIERIPKYTLKEGSLEARVPLASDYTYEVSNGKW